MSFAEKLKVLVPLDGTVAGASALPAIHQLVHTGPIECTLLHVADSGSPVHGIEATLEQHRKTLESLGVPTQVLLVHGKPAEEIHRQTAGGAFDLVAMSTHGRRGLDRVVMGSLAEEVVRSSLVPTLLCRMGVRAASWDRIVVALDGMPGGEEVLEDVQFLASRLGATVHLIQVGLNLLFSNGYRGVAIECPEPEPSGYLEDIAARLLSRGIPVQTDHRLGKAASEIARFAKDLEAGLICMTTHGRPDELPGLERSVAAEVVRQAPCPVYVRRMTGASLRPR